MANRVRCGPRWNITGRWNKLDFGVHQLSETCAFVEFHSRDFVAEGRVVQCNPHTDYVTTFFFPLDTPSPNAMNSRPGFVFRDGDFLQSPPQILCCGLWHDYLLCELFKTHIFDAQLHATLITPCWQNIECGIDICQ